MKNLEDNSGAGGAAPRPEPAISSSVFAILLFIFTELMFFAGLISAYMIVSAGEAWPPPDQPRLPVEATALNSLVLLASGITMFLARRAFTVQPFSLRSRSLLTWTVGLGLFFVCFQGFEWARLLSHGLTMKSSVYGAFFYLIIGTHALHAIAAILAIYFMFRRFRRGSLKEESFQAHAIFWYFVVGVWPVLYSLVYLS